MGFQEKFATMLSARNVRKFQDKFVKLFQEKYARVSRERNVSQFPKRNVGMSPGKSVRLNARISSGAKFATMSALLLTSARVDHHLLNYNETDPLPCTTFIELQLGNKIIST